MTVLAFLIFVPLQLVWLPVSVIAASWVAYKQLVISKRLGVSQTAVEIINGRWTMHVFGMRTDTAACKLAAKLPNNSVTALFLTLFPLWIARKIAGKPVLYPTLPPLEKAGLANLIPSRTMEIDAFIRAEITAVEQFVSLGAGLDTRAYAEDRNQTVRWIEVDREATQTHKRTYLETARVASDHVAFVAIDFADPDWISQLISSPYDASRPTLFLWEGVTLYLSRDSVSATLAALKTHAPPGSAIIADFYSNHFVSKLGKRAQKLLDLTGEGFGFGLDFSTQAEAVLRTFIAAQNVELEQVRFLGSAGKNGPYLGIALIRL